MSNLSPFFKSIPFAEATHEWKRTEHDDTVCLTPTLAAHLADRIVQHLCARTPQHYQAWCAKRDNNIAATPTIARGLKAFITPAFGEPGGDEKHPDHIQGYVAEHLWYFLMMDEAAELDIVHVEPPGFKSTDPGGDSLVIRRTQSGELTFAIWEIKKNSGDDGVSGTIGHACNQLRDNALEYLARYTSTTPQLPDAALDALYGKLIDFWVEASPRAGAAVCVATSASNAPKRTAFSQLPTTFPQFTTPPRLTGQLAVVGDFASFAKSVRDAVWTGL